MRKTIFIFLIALGSVLSAFAQKPASDTLRLVRKLFQTDVYKNNVKLSKTSFEQLLVQSRTWSNKNKTANVFLVAAPIISAGGAYLAYDGIKGTPKVTYIDGKPHPYVVRSLPKLLGGLALFATGFCLIESANETKKNAAKWYNSTIKEAQLKKQPVFSLKLDISKSGQIGLLANF